MIVIRMGEKNTARSLHGMSTCVGNRLPRECVHQTIEIKKVSRSEYLREPLSWLAQSKRREDGLIQVRSDGALIGVFRDRAPRRDTSAELAIDLAPRAGMM